MFETEALVERLKAIASSLESILCFRLIQTLRRLLS